MSFCCAHHSWKDELRESPLACRESGTLSARPSNAALTLLEMMVAVTLLAVIMIGLVAMFNQTQKALHVANAQTDVFENARGAIQLIARDLVEMTAFDQTNVLNGFANPIPSPIPNNGALPLPSGGNQPLDFSEAFWLARANDDWQGIGYYVAEDPAVNKTNFGIGTLYRFSGTVRQDRAPELVNAFSAQVPTNVHRISEGIVHFALSAGYIDYLQPTNRLGQPHFVRTNRFGFWSNSLPSFVDVEIGVLEPATLKQFQALRDLDLAAAQRFLIDHAGRVHFFRERVPIRNFINPYRSNEVP